MRKYAVIPAIIIGGIASFLIGYYLFKIGNIENEQQQNLLLAENYDIYTNNAEYISVKANNSEQKITPNTTIIKKVYYIDCEHIKQESEEVNEKLINMNESQFQAEYIGWEIQKFTNNEIIVYKEINDFCDEHYVLKDTEGKITIFLLDKYGNEKEIIRETEIETKYLPELDIENLKEGIKVYGNEELNKLLEDYE